MNRPILKAVALLLALPWFGQSPAIAFQRMKKAVRAPEKKSDNRFDPRAARPPETSSDSSFDPTKLVKLAVILPTSGGPRAIQTDQQRLVEDEVVQVLIQKGYSIVSRSDIQAVVKEQGFQKSGLTEDNAVALGKLLNVSAVMVVRITESAATNRVDTGLNRNVLEARASLGARLMGVESGAILWTGTHSKSDVVGGQGDVSLVLADVSRTLAGAFPDRDPARGKDGRTPAKDVSSDRSFDPKALTKLAVIVIDPRQRDTLTDQQRLVEDEFMQVLIRKGYSIVSRSDIKTVVKEQGLQKSGLTEDNAVALGKLLNVPAVMVVRITDFAVGNQKDPATGRPGTVARISVGARLVSVESGLILWTNSHIGSENVAGQGDGRRALADVARDIAGNFPVQDPENVPTRARDDKDPVKDVASDRSFNPKTLEKLAVIVVEDLRQRGNQVDMPRLVEDEFVQALQRKGYGLVSRSDIQALAKEKAFQKSGLTEDNAAAIGKLLNVPAVVVVRITESAVEGQTDPRTRRPYNVARAALGARLVSVESGLILWTGTHVESSPGDRGDLSRVLAYVAKTMAGAFPDKNRVEGEVDRGRGGPQNPEADRLTEGRAATLLKSAQNLERLKKTDAALNYYRQVTKDFPETSQAKTAAERIEALTKK